MIDIFFHPITKDIVFYFWDPFIIILASKVNGAIIKSYKQLTLLVVDKQINMRMLPSGEALVIGFKNVFATTNLFKIDLYTLYS